MDSLSCEQFANYLSMRAEHLDYDIMRDVTPLEGWVGHVSVGMFPSQDGVEHTFDRINRVYPQLTGCWEDVGNTSCVGQPCDPNETEIGFGLTRDSYKLQRRSYKTQLFCFDQLISVDRATEQFNGILKNLKDATVIITSDRYKMEAARICGRKYLTSTAGATNQLVPITSETWDAECETVTLNAGVVPSSLLSMEMLQNLVQPLLLDGYNGIAPGVPLFELVTDMETAFQLREGNSDVSEKYRFTDFAKGGELYKYGVTDAVGNFGIRFDLTPPRFQINGTDLVRVFPYNNTDSSQVSPGGPTGIKGVVNDVYLKAPVQISYIWHREVMVNLVQDMSQINSEMPYAVRNLAGKWMWAMNNLGADENGCVIANPRGNKGIFLADFSMATKAHRPEWGVALWHVRQSACIVDIDPCAAAPAYVAQDASSANAPCEFVTEITTIAISSTELPPNSVVCNGSVIGHGGTTATAMTDLVTFLNTDTATAALGLWSGTGTTLTLTGSVCASMSIPAIEA